jgi:glucose-1-phosphate thymidylyltransferase
MLKAVVLAAGKGTRLYPITQHIAKPLLPIVNRTTLFYAFDRLKEIGVEEVCLVVGENEGQMRSALGDGAAAGVRLTYVKQTDPHGLAHAVGFAKEFVDGQPFVLYLGDAMYSTGFGEFAEAFRSSGCANLNLVKWVEDPRRYGVAVLANAGAPEDSGVDRVARLVEKPQNPESNWAMAGLYFFGPELWEVLPNLKPSARGEYEITDAIQMLIDAGHNVMAGKYTGTWFDTGTRESFLDTCRFFANGVNVVDGHVVGEVGANVIIGQGAKVSCAKICDSVVLPGATIDGDADLCGCVLAGSAKLTGSVRDQILYDGLGV